MEKCTNYDHCNNTVPSVKNNEIPYQFCSWDCNESHYLQEGKKIRLELEKEKSIEYLRIAIASLNNPSDESLKIKTK